MIWLDLIFMSKKSEMPCIGISITYQLWLCCVSELLNDSTPMEVKCKAVLFFCPTTSSPFHASIEHSG